MLTTTSKSWPFIFGFHPKVSAMIPPKDRATSVDAKE